MKNEGALKIATPNDREVVMTRRLCHSESWLDTVLDPSQDVRDAVLKAGVERGEGESYERLAEVLASCR